jgi:hypothetical protein
VPPIIGTIVAAAQVLYPAIEKVPGIAGVQVRRAVQPMIPDRARTILRLFGQTARLARSAGSLPAPGKAEQGIAAQP